MAEARNEHHSVLTLRQRIKDKRVKYLRRLAFGAVITVRSVTALSAVNLMLANKRQMVAFDPPHCGADATVNGMALLAHPAVVLNVLV